MPAANRDLINSPLSPEQQPTEPLTRLPFPLLTRSHILHCSCHYWYPLYRTITPKARLIPLNAAFLSYLRADGIVLPPSIPSSPSRDVDTDSGIFSSSNSEQEDDEETNPSTSWPQIHNAILSTIASLGGSVYPKLNWSAPKDATWIAATNSMECRSPNDIYLLLKSSDFITHDLEHAFDGCTSSHPPSEEEEIPEEEEISYTLTLRKTIPSLIPSLEFRCFVRARTLLCVCQRDLNHYSFLPSLVPVLKPLIQTFFDERLRDTFSDENFVFDVYVPQPREKGRVWLMDINPWAERTDPLVFSWVEILSMEVPKSESEDLLGGVLRMSMRDGLAVPVEDNGEVVTMITTDDDKDDDDDDSASTSSSEDTIPLTSESGFEFRLINRDDPEAYNFNAQPYSAHKLPKDVVDAGVDGDGESGLREFMTRWREVVKEQEEREKGDEEEEEGEAR